uniref:E-beta-farnesene synthase n=1 Tax=Tanacetum cinerariifolium TaxID=118510 RepID=A0A699GZJ9_TANCI|nr:E-beta-farnesene synthase [Tanacetum cinerariifolium]
MEPEDSLRMGDEHFDTISGTESDEFIKSCVENLVPNPSEYKDLSNSECDMPVCDDFTTFSNLLFNADADFSSSDNESFSDKDISKEIYSNPLFDKEIISIKIDPHHFNAESDLIESLLNHDSSIISSSSKIDSLLDEFASELILLKSIPPGIDKTDCDLEEEIRLIEKLFDSFMEEIDLSFTPNDSMPPGIEYDDYGSQVDMFILEEFLSNDSLSLPEKESFYFDIPSSLRPPAKPLDDDSEILTVKVVGDIFEHYVPMPRLLPTQPTLASNQEKSPHLLSHQGFKAFQLPLKSSMIIYKGKTPILDVMDIKEKDKIEAKTGQNQARNGKRGTVNQVKAKVKVKPVKTGHGFGKSTKNRSRRHKYLIGPTQIEIHFPFFTSSINSQSSVRSSIHASLRHDPGRALTTIIYLYLTGKTSGFERPKDPVLQILWGVINQAHIDYTERIWEEFTQSINTFIKDKKNLAQHTHEKKKATLIVIPSIRFTKLVIHYLQSKHKFHPRPDSPIHLPNEEHVLRYLKFSAKGTKREVFGMPIPGKLITADIQGEPYYKEYLEKVAKHQRYLTGEKGSDPNSLAPKPAKTTKKSKPSVSKADLRPPVIKPALSQQPEPKPAPAKSQGKKRKLVTSLEESVDEDILEKEPRFDNEEADVQKAFEESLKSVYDGLGVRFHPWSLENQTLGNINRFQRFRERVKRKRTSTPTESSGHDESSSLYAELGLTDSEVKSDKDVPGTDAGVQDEGQAGPNPGDDATSQPQSSPAVHAGPNLEHMDLEATDVSTQLHPEQMDEGFTATAYPSVHENLKLTVKEQVILKEPASSTGTLSSLQHLAKDLSFGDLFFNDKPSEADNENTTAEIEAASMVFVTIQQDTSPIPPMTTPIIDLTSRPDSPNAIQALLRNRFRDLLEADMKEILHQRMWETKSYKAHEDHSMLYEALEKSMNRDNTGELLKDLAEARKKKKKRRDSQKMPPGSPPHQPPLPPPPAGQTHGSTALSSLKTVALAEYKAWITTDKRLRLSVSSTPEDLHMDDDMAPDAQVHSSDDEDIMCAYIPKNNWASALASTYSPPPEDLLLAQTGDMAMFMDWFCKRQGITKLKPQDLEGSTFELVKVFHPDVTIQYDFFFNKDLDYLRYGSKGNSPALSISKMKAAYYPNVGLEQMVPDHMWIEEECKYDIATMYGISHWWFQRQRFYIDKHTSEGDRRAVRTHMWILSVVRIEVFSMYGYGYMKKIVLRRVDLNEHIIAERDFKYLYPSDFKDLYLLNLQGHLNHLPPKDMKILTTAVNLWTRHLVIRQHVEDFQLGIESYQSQLNLTKPRWEATGFDYKHDYMVIDSSRAVTFRDKYGVQMIMQFNEIHKFSDGTLHQIDEALDYRVKEFKVNKMNLGLKTRFWTRKDVDRSKEFMFAIQIRLKTRRIFRNLESFVGERVRDRDYRLLKRTE